MKWMFQSRNDFFQTKKVDIFLKTAELTRFWDIFWVRLKFSNSIEIDWNYCWYFVFLWCFDMFETLLEGFQKFDWNFFRSKIGVFNNHRGIVSKLGIIHSLQLHNNECSERRIDWLEERGSQCMYHMLQEIPEEFFGNVILIIMSITNDNDHKKGFWSSFQKEKQVTRANVVWLEISDGGDFTSNLQSRHPILASSLNNR